ncbi:MAG: hydroxyacylglutathione hydrolase family protein [Candidatus Woesearchaeota archaeon]|jgi:glyoxylase-like metal-dependent hydrolase (beta-lactamase superfamily II)
MKIEWFKGGYDKNFFYILSSEGKAAIIDCFDAKLALEYIRNNQLKLDYIISTHNHFDHVDSNSRLQEKSSAKLVMFKSNDCDLKVDEGSKLELGKSVLQILHTPGHSMDSICILADNKYLFTGDTLFVGTIGGVFCENGEAHQKESLKRLMTLNDNIIVYPGHDYGQVRTSTIKMEKLKNPALLKVINRK